MSGMVSTNQAAFGAALADVMAGAGIGSVPVDIADGHIVDFGFKEVKRAEIEPLVGLKGVEIDVRSVPGYWESAGGNGSAHSAELKRAWLESRPFFKDWSALQKDANWAAAIPGGELEGAARLANSDFAAAIANHLIGTNVARATARSKYETLAIRYEVEKNFTAAAMVWERAATNPDHLMPEKLYRLHRGRASRAWYKSLPRQNAEFDPVSLRLARGIWYAYGIDEQYYRMLLMRSAKQNERIDRKFDSGACRLRLALSILKGEKVGRASLSVAASMIASASLLFEGSGRRDVDSDKLMALAKEIERVSEVE